MILMSHIYELETSVGRSRIIRSRGFWKLEAWPKGQREPLVFTHKDLRTVQAKRKAFHDGRSDPA